jgi:DNA-binding NtrC family response regulator
MTEGRFRSDLYYRISALELRIPPLSERPEDVPVIARRILDSFAREVGRSVPGISESALGVLQAHTWPGNVRELRNVLETAVLRNRSEQLEPEDLRLRSSPAEASSGALPTLAEVERRHIRRALEVSGGHVGRAARALGVSTSSLYERIRRFGLSVATDPGAGSGRLGSAGGTDRGGTAP